MSIFQTAGKAGKKIVIQPSKFDDGCVLITILARDGAEVSIAVDPHSANMLANNLEREAVNAFAADLKAVPV